MTRPPENPASVDDRIRQVRDGLFQLLSDTGNKHLREECWPRWDRALDDLREQVRRPPEVSVSLVGGTGAGKTTLINALLGWRLLPTKEGQPCTSAVCEIAHADDGGFHAEVEFVTRDEWDAEARRLRADLAASLPVAGESDEDRKVSAALTKAALQKLRAVYKLGEEAGPEHVVGADLPEPEAVKRALSAGAETLSYGPDAADKFADHVKLFLAADQPFWPIVRAVRVRGPFDALRGGLRLIDLPGVNDPSEAREQILRQKLKDCKFVWLIFGIKRALTRDVVELMQGEDFFRQLILDGRTDRLTFVGTHSDDVNFEEACKQYQLPEDAPVEYILSARKAALKDAIGHTLADLAYRLAEQSGEDRAKADALAGRLSRFALFSVSARDYLAFVKKKGRDKPRLDAPDQTELPALKQHLADLAREYGAAHHDRLIRQQLQTLLREVDRELQAQRVGLDQRLEMAAGQRKEVQAAAAAALTFLGGKLTEHQERYAQDLAASRGVLTERFRRGVERGRQGIEGTLAKWNGLHQNTLAAVCRGGGRSKTTTGLHDLPPDLTKPLLDSIAFTWDEFFGERLTQVMRDWYGKLKDLAGRHAETFHVTVAGRLRAGSVLKANLARLQEATEKVLAEQLEQSRTQMQERIDRTRGTLYERVPDRVRAVLRPTFEKAGKESGKGMKQRIIEDHLRPAVFAVARDVFRDAEQEIEAELRVLQDTLTRAYAEMAGTVHRHAQLNVDNLWQGAHELSTDGIEAERKRLAAAAGKLAELAAAA